jgi:N-hydroxyarylamine O-acetyltransferase
MALRVHADGTAWLADVGFGSGLLAPLPFDGGAPARQGGWEYALAVVGPRAWELRERWDGEWVARYGFDDQRQHPADVVVANHFTSTWPQSPFVTRSVVVRKDRHALRELIDRTLTVTRPDGSTEQREVSGAELPGTLEELFGLSLGPGELARL